MDRLLGTGKAPPIAAQAHARTLTRWLLEATLIRMRAVGLKVLKNSAMGPLLFCPKFVPTEPG